MNAELNLVSDTHHIENVLADVLAWRHQDIKVLIRRLELAYVEAQNRDRTAARAAAEKAAAEYGYTLSQIMAAPPKKRSQKPKSRVAASSPKYRNPADQSQTWAGKGRPPGWYKAAIEAGETPESMKI